MNLISQWYTPKDPQRLREIILARKSNESSGLFSKLTYLNGDQKRWSFREMFDLASSQHRGEVCVIANTDIMFDSATMRELPSICKPMRLVALTRWEDDSSPRMLGHFVDRRFFSGTQDSWAFIGGSLPAMASDVQMGIVGCDQIVAGWAAESGCEVLNPALSIKTFHVHEIENAHEGEPTADGVYGYPELTTLAGASGRVLLHSFPMFKTAITCQR